MNVCPHVRNYTIRFMPVPIMDAAQALRSNPEKTEDALLKVLFPFPNMKAYMSQWWLSCQIPVVLQMEQYLLRNHETRKYLQEQAYRLQQGIVTTTTQQAGRHTHTHRAVYRQPPKSKT